jgi:hypothetical protein
VIYLDGHIGTGGKASTSFGRPFFPRSNFSAGFEFSIVQREEFQPLMKTNGRESFLDFPVVLYKLPPFVNICFHSRLKFFLLNAIK